MIKKKDKMLKFWSDRVKLYKHDPRANTNDIWIREIEIEYVDKIIKSYAFKTVMDFGCGNGYSTTRLAMLNKNIVFTGVDLNHDMISAAMELPKKENLPNLKFKQADIIMDNIPEKYDFIYTIRALQNIESLAMQKKIFDKLYDLLNNNAIFLYIESYLDGYQRLNKDRAKMGLTPLPIHEHLTLLTEDFDIYVSGKMSLIEKQYLSSSYYLITRLLYSYIAKINNEPIDYNHIIHQVAAMVPQTGDYGPQKASLLVRKD